MGPHSFIEAFYGLDLMCCFAGVSSFCFLLPGIIVLLACYYRQVCDGILMQSVSYQFVRLCCGRFTIDS